MRRRYNGGMDIKIGLAESPRELVIRPAAGAEDVTAVVEQAIEAGTPVIKLSDDKGRNYLIRTDRIIYVEQGSATTHSVGFMR